MARSSLTKYLKLFGFIIALLVSMGGLWLSWVKNFAQSSGPNTSSQSISSLRKAPFFSLPDSREKVHSLSEYQGKWMVLHFWASWCTPCLDEIPLWVELSRKWEGKKIQWVAISLDQSWKDAEKILPSKDLPSNLSSLLDQSTQVPETYGTFQFPETYLISPDQKIVTKWVGSQDWTSPQMVRFFHKLLEGETDQKRTN